VEPSGASIELAMLRLPATGPATHAPIIYLAGGPGDSGIENLRIPGFAELFDSLRTTADVILLDQRGTGRTQPQLRCAGLVPPTNLFRDESTFRGALREGMTACAAQFRARGIDPSAYTTVASANDVDAIRRALGVERVSLLGFSYGTHLALATIRLHGAHIERAIIAGVEGPDDNEKRPLVMDQNLERLAAVVRDDRTLGPLVPDLVVTYDSALARLRREPARLRVPNPAQQGDTVTIEIGAFGFQHIVVRDLGDTNDWPALPGLIVRTAQGDYGLLTQFARRRWGALPSLMWAATDCASGSSIARSTEAAAQAKLSRFGTSMAFADAALCKSIAAADLGDAFRLPIASSVPTLFISGTLDSQTPPYQAEAIRWGFTRGVHIIVENAGHESTLPAPAVRAAIARFARGEPVQSQFIQLPLPAFRGPGR
jgi:pimeloyl-ACP methyl ester carboxylesterase